MEENRLPELPNIITLLNHVFQEHPVIRFILQWENVFFSLLIATGISLLFYFGTRKRELIPSGLQNFLEYVVELIRSLITSILGPVEGEKYLPFLGTLFIYILTMNLFGIIPLMKSPSASLNTTVALALCVFCLVQYLNIKNMGLFGFFYHMAGEPKSIGGWIFAPFMLILELITQLARPVTLSLRLFGNVMGEDILLGIFAIFGITILASYNPPVGLPLQIPFMFVALLTSFMQALVFTLLSTIYIFLSMVQHEEKHHPESKH